MSRPGPRLVKQDAAPTREIDPEGSKGVNVRPTAPSILKQARQKEALEDQALIERAQRGDKEAFRHLVERHQRRGFSIAYALVRDENDAHEVVQEAFVRVYKGLKSFQGSASFFTWLYRIVTNLSIDHMRKPGSRLRSELEEGTHEVTEDDEERFPFLSRIDGADPHEVVRRKEIGERLRKAMDALPSYHRAVILMREVEGLSYEEMAQAMSVSKGTIMSRLFHARQKLQRALSDCYEEQVGHLPPAKPNAETATASDSLTETSRTATQPAKGAS